MVTAAPSFIRSSGHKRRLPVVVLSLIIVKLEDPDGDPSFGALRDWRPLLILLLHVRPCQVQLVRTRAYIRGEGAKQRSEEAVQGRRS